MDKLIFILSLSVFAIMLGTALLGDTVALKAAQARTEVVSLR
jgi:hypothetical protein